jgi:hypothetical protein
MFVLTSPPVYGTHLVRPLNKTTDRSVIREIFRREFYGDCRQQYPDEELWHIYDRMETNEVYGAYLVSRLNHILFLLEIHPTWQMDLPAEYLSQPGTVGIYCFYHSTQELVNLTALSACIASLLSYPGITRIVTLLSHVAPDDFRAALLRNTGFGQLTEGNDRTTIWCCTRESFDKTNIANHAMQLQEY